MEEPAGRTVIVVHGRVMELPAHRSSHPNRRGAASAWGTSLALLGGLVLLLGAFVGANWGSAAAIGGFAMFLTTAVLAGTERYELATGLGVSAVVWTAAGISVYLGVDRSLFGSFLGFAFFGSTALVAGVLGIRRSRLREPDRSDPDT